MRGASIRVILTFMATLVTPSLQYEKTYREALAEFQSEDRMVGRHLDFDGKESFDEFISRL